MSKSKYLFHDIKSFGEYKKAIGDMVVSELDNRRVYSNSERALQYLSETTDTLAIKKMFAESLYIDKKLSKRGKINGNIYKKLPTMLAGIILMHDYELGDYSLDEISMLSLFLSSSAIEEYDDAIQLFPREVLAEIAKKTGDYENQEELMNLLEFSPKCDIICKLRSESLEDLLQESYRAQQEYVDNLRLEEGAVCK